MDPLASFGVEQDYEGSGRASKGASNGGGAYRPPPSRRGMSGAMTDESSGEDRNDRKRSRPKANSLALQGRFSGRLAEKADEQRLVAECALLGPLLGESQPQTLSTLVRGIATGKVRKFLEDHLPAPGTETQTKWHSQSAMAAAEERERRISVLQQEVDSLKARLWDSAARIGDLEKVCAAQQSQLAMAHISPGDAPQVDASLNGSAIHAPQPVRFGHAPTSGFTRLPSVGPPGGGLPPGPGRNAALDHGLSPGMSPAMGGGASNMEMSRAMAARSGSGLTPGLTPGLSGSLSGLATPTGMNSWMGPNGGVPDYSANATLAELTAQLGAYSQEQLAAAVRATRPDSGANQARAPSAGSLPQAGRSHSQELGGRLQPGDHDPRQSMSPRGYGGGGPGATLGSGGTLQEHLATLTAAASVGSAGDPAAPPFPPAPLHGSSSSQGAAGGFAVVPPRGPPRPLMETHAEMPHNDYQQRQPAQMQVPSPASAMGQQAAPMQQGDAYQQPLHHQQQQQQQQGQPAVDGFGQPLGQDAAPPGQLPMVMPRNSAGEDVAAAALVNLVQQAGGDRGGSAGRSSNGSRDSRRPQRRTGKPRSDHEDYET